MTATVPMTACANCTRPFSAIRAECPHCGFPVPGVAAAASTSLFPCAACEHQVSRAARACPGCGQPMRCDHDRVAPALFVAAILFASVMGAYYFLLVSMWGHFPLQGQDGGYGPIEIMLVLFILALATFCAGIWQAQKD